MRKTLIIVSLCAAFFPKSAMSLTVDECIEVEQKYGIISDLCEQLLVKEQEPTEAVEPAAQSVNGPVLPTPSRNNSVTQKQIENHVFFPNGGTAFDDTALKQVERVAAVLNTSVFQNTCVQLIGHSDDSGLEKTNLEIGLKRAQGVARRLGVIVSPKRIESVLSMGETKPLSNIAPSNRFQRRVEIRVRRCQT